MSSGDALDRGRDAFKRQAWGRAVAELTAADRNGSLGLDDLERLARAAYLAGKDERSIEVWTRAHHESIRLGDPARAAASALWIAFVFTHKGDVAHGGGWVARAQRLLDDGPLDCVEQGYLLVFAAMRSVFAGDAETACSTFREAGRIGERFGDTDLMTFARVGEGRTLIYLGRIAEGMAMLDEAMVAVTAGEVSPIVAGDVYCSVIEACQELFDLRRAQEWTAALGHWCDAQQDLVLYRGQCLVHRVEIMQLHGAWPDAIAEAQRAFERFADPPGQPAVGAAYYQRAELHRLRGEFDEAEEAYRLATEWGRNPQPGLALLRLAQGQLSAAEAAIRRELDEAQDPITRPKLLPAFVQIVLVANDVAEARAAAEELSGFAANLDAPYLHAVAAHATGAVVLAEGDARAALDPLRRALTGWRDLEAPYEAARVRMLIGLACRALGDEDTATMELNAARSVFEQLGAEPDLARVEEVPATRTEAGGLTGREVEVMRLVAAGKTNRAIAGELFISEKTVARHLSNIFVKLGVSSRTAAAAYAYEHDLV